MAGRVRAKNGADAQVVRALALLMEMARSRRGVLLKAFAEKRGYRWRNVYRDRDALQAVGVPIRQNPDSRTRWQLVDGWLPPAIVGAGRDELIALYVARQLAPGLRGTTVGESLEKLWSKLSNPGPQQTLPLQETALPYSSRALPAIEYGRHRLTIDRLRDAIERKHAVRIQYRTPDAAITDRIIEPGFLHWDGGLEAMYVPSWCRLRQAIRVFAVHRILAIESLPNDAARAVPARRAVERAFRIWLRDKTEHVEVLFTAKVAGEIRERQWHASQRLVEARDGGTYLHLDISAPDELVRWLLGFGPEARVISPDTLAEEIRRQHVQAAGLGQVFAASEPRRDPEQKARPQVAARRVRARRDR